ncbi:hypothetical protein NBRC10512_002149 [Rhodotorula toruloides]|uniref:RHTO0S18e01200g1_1 n=2 Tax=Rhodotorula toruloides TaxID=5286 RepID=A0A061BEX1_RHOTO|nr:short-chain dehydrogenase/reductase SDR family protein [Rhodotorula toruloides NP11]EMS21415.1 short-chain dehydrogenase/reductase SDR family protein [Rhodotorula toruloides NP11]KAJ8291300.1 15-hydroxyprostaglandin dehydrogenase [NAD(+)] [Rhodotorula toruloides]CDR48489.1 RHTO0S18e01200g1_1 [Rhodotorula toruloides]
MAYVGKVAIVTGAASGIGLGITEHLLKEGAKVMVADLNEQQGQKVVADLAKSHGTDKVAFCSTNVTEWSSICNLFAHTYKTFGPRIDFVFANAGIAQMREMRSSDPTHFATTAHSSLNDLSSRPPSLAVIRVNLDGVLYTLHAALAYFRQQEKDQDGWRGKFVATGSNASFYPFPNDPLYAAAKQGVLGTCRAVGPKVIDEGITVNCFGPSVVATGLAPPDFIAMLEREHRLTPMKTVTNAVDVFINPKSRVTGQIIENCGLKNVFRAIPTYMDEAARLNMNEFHPSDQIDRALSVEGAGLEVVA